MRLMILLVIAVGAGMHALYRLHGSAMLPPASVQQSTTAAQTFVSYTNAVAAFMDANRTFVGSVSASQLAAQGTPFSTAFLAKAGNTIAAFGSNGRTVISYAQLPAGSLSSVIRLTGRDASYGTSAGSTWTSVAPGAVAQPFTVSVPSGSVVSVIQIGN